MTKFKEWGAYGIDVLVGGTPCQSFSVAGLRKGLDDPRGNLMLTYLAIADQYRPRWLVWENVPGVLSSNGGKDFGTFLGGLGELGYGFAYRVLDAQYFGVAQRRRRVFVVACLGDWRGAAAVLFERHSLQGHPAPSREAGESPAKCLTRGANQRLDFETEDFVTAPVAPTLGRCAFKTPGNDFSLDGGLVAHSLRGEGFDASEDGTGRGTPLVPVGADLFNGDLTGDVAATMGTRGSSQNSSGPTLMAGMQVRRLTPRECERLQGFRDNYTNVPHRGKPAADGPRYKALGNSMAVPVMADRPSHPDGGRPGASAEGGRMKPRKKYQPRRVTIPMIFMQQSVLDKYPHLATSVYGQIYAFIERPCVESSNNLCRQLAVIAGGMSHMQNGAPIRGRRDAGSLAICSAVQCMEGIGNRFERTGVIAVNDIEAQTLKAAAGRLDEVLQGMPLACWLKAEAEAHVWLRESQRVAA